VGKNELAWIIEEAVKIVEKLEQKDKAVFQIRAKLMQRLRKWEAVRKERYKRIPEELKQRILFYDKKANLIDAQIAKILIEHVLEVMIAEDEQRTEYKNLLSSFSEKREAVIRAAEELITLLADQKIFIKQVAEPLQDFRHAVEKVYAETGNRDLYKLRIDIEYEQNIAEKFKKDIDAQTAIVEQELGRIKVIKGAA
jgi:hypothetical protein